MDILINFLATVLVIVSCAFTWWVIAVAVPIMRSLIKPKRVPTPRQLQEGINEIFMKEYGDL